MFSDYLEKNNARNSSLAISGWYKSQYEHTCIIRINYLLKINKSQLKMHSINFTTSKHISESVTRHSDHESFPDWNIFSREIKCYSKHWSKCLCSYWEYVHMYRKLHICNFKSCMLSEYYMHSNIVLFCEYVF